MKKSTLIVVGAFVVLALAWFATREKQVAVGVHRLSLSAVQPEALTKLVVGATTLEQDGGRWVVSVSGGPKFAADEAAVKSLQRTLAQLKAPDFVSDRAEKLADYELDDAKGVKVSASTAQGPVRELVVGKAAKNGGEYLRDAKSNDVFVTRDGLGYQVRRTLALWRKKDLVSLKPEDLVRVELPGGALERKDSAWSLSGVADGFPLDQDAAKNLVAQLGALSVVDFLDAAPTEPELARVKLVAADAAKSVELVLHGKRGDGNYPLRVTGDAQTYVLGAWIGDRLAAGVESVRDLRPLHFDAAQVKKVTLSTGKERVVAAKDGDAWKLLEPKKLPDGFDFDGALVGTLVQELQGLRGDKLATLDEAKAGLARPAVQVELELAAGGAKKLRLAQTGPTVFGAGDDGHVYEVNAGRKAALERGLERFRRLPPPHPSGITGLEQLPPELRAQLEAQLRAQQR
ncbi:MAG: DUF4340 domain-containing protein [Myxococcota bacterium]